MKILIFIMVSALAEQTGREHSATHIGEGETDFFV